MKIGFDAKRAFLNTTGLGNYSRDLIRSMVEYYPENEYYLFSPRLKNSDFLIWAKKQTQVSIITPGSLGTRILGSYWRSFKILKCAQKLGLDIYHGLSGEIPRTPKKCTVKTIVTVHDLIFIRYPKQYKPIDRFFYTRKARYATKKASIVVAISEQTKKDIVSFLGIDARKINVIYQSCHTVFRHETDLSKKLPNGLPENYLLSVGTLEERKNLLSLIQAMPLIPDIKLVVVGKRTGYWEKVKAEIIRLNLKDRVIPLQGLSVEELAAIYKNARVFIYPSIFEGFGIPVIEALFSGVPVVTNRSGCFPEAGGLFSSYVDVSNPKEIADAVNTILNSEEIQAKMNTEGKKYAQKFCPEPLAEQWQNLYLKLRR